MRETRIIMGMPIEIEIVGSGTEDSLNDIFNFLTEVDARFSTYKEDSEISRMNRGELKEKDLSSQMSEILALADKTKRETEGYFDVHTPDGSIDPSGIVKGWAILKAAELMKMQGYTDFFINAGGDIASSGKNAQGEEWSFGIRSPFNTSEIVKVVYPKGAGIATSGSYIRGAHIYNPHAPEQDLLEVVSITVIGPDVLEADRFATAAFAMGKGGIAFIEKLSELEGYAIGSKGIATFTSGFFSYLVP